MSSKHNKKKKSLFLLLISNFPKKIKQNKIIIISQRWLWVHIKDKDLFYFINYKWRGEMWQIHFKIMSHKVINRMPLALVSMNLSVTNEHPRPRPYTAFLRLSELIFRLLVFLIIRVANKEKTSFCYRLTHPFVKPTVLQYCQYHSALIKNLSVL